VGLYGLPKELHLWGVGRMNADVVYGLLFANLLLLYLIGLRIRSMKNDVECMHRFTHALGEHPFFEILGMRMSHMMAEEEDESEVPDAFKQWDES